MHNANLTSFKKTLVPNSLRERNTNQLFDVSRQITLFRNEREVLILKGT